jgi:hypothetical protein
MGFIVVRVVRHGITSIDLLNEILELEGREDVEHVEIIVEVGRDKRQYILSLHFRSEVKNIKVIVPNV